MSLKNKIACTTALVLLLASTPRITAQYIYAKGLISPTPERIIPYAGYYTSYGVEYTFNSKNSIFVARNSNTVNDRLGYNHYFSKKVKYLFLNTALHRRYWAVNGNVDIRIAKGIDIGIGKKFMLRKFGIETTTGVFACRQQHKLYTQSDPLNGLQYKQTTKSLLLPYFDFTLVYKIDLSTD